MALYTLQTELLMSVNTDVAVYTNDVNPNHKKTVMINMMTLILSELQLILVICVCVHADITTVSCSSLVFQLFLDLYERRLNTFTLEEWLRLGNSCYGGKYCFFLPLIWMHSTLGSGWACGSCSIRSSS